MSTAEWMQPQIVAAPLSLCETIGH